MKLKGLQYITLVLGVLAAKSNALYLDVDDYDSIVNATSLLATGLMDYYWGFDYGGTIGMFTSPYYWWEAGGAFGSMLDHWYFFQNDTYEDIIMQSLIYQAGDNWDYMPLNQTTTEGNDDQVFWGIAAMQAAERNFTNPKSSDEPQWLYLAQAVFNTMAWRWDSADCGGGLRWQIFQWNSGYDYKNSISNAGLFHIGARLARYTSNDTYVQWCEQVYDWLLDVKYIIEGDYYIIYDGASIEDNCTSVTKYQWTYNSALVLGGCAYLYNYTEEDIWLERVNGHLNGASAFFFNNSIMYEASCQGGGSCATDQRSFKAYLSRFLGITAVLVPSTYDKIRKLVVASAMGAAESCSGGYDGHTCGLNWFYGGWDNYYGLGEQMSALEIMQALVVNTRPAPYTADNGGSSIGDGAAGSASEVQADKLLDLHTKDTAGAAVITAVIGISIITGFLWLML